MESSCVFGDNIGMVVLDGKDKLCLIEFGFVVLVRFNLGSSY